MAISSTNDPAFLNSRSRQAVDTMSEFLAANSSTDKGLPLHHILRDAEAESGAGYDIDIAGLTPAIHVELTEVNRTLTSLQELQTV